jgi:hypothetical protein
MLLVRARAGVSCVGSYISKSCSADRTATHSSVRAQGQYMQPQCRKHNYRLHVSTVTTDAAYEQPCTRLMQPQVSLYAPNAVKQQHCVLHTLQHCACDAATTGKHVLNIHCTQQYHVLYEQVAIASIVRSPGQCSQPAQHSLSPASHTN